MTFEDPEGLPQYEQLPEEVRVYIANLRDALNTRTVLGQATGLMAAQGNLTTDDAWNVLTELSNMSNVRVTIVGQVLVNAHNGGTNIDPGTISRVTARMAEAAQRVRNHRPTEPAQDNQRAQHQP